MRSPSKSIRSLMLTRSLRPGTAGGGALLAFALSLSLAAQTTTGRIVGSVRDVSGAPLAGAVVTIVDVQRDTARSTVADDSGGYAVPNLAPGSYTVRAVAPGFKTLERSRVQLEVASDLTVDLSLPPGDVKETVQVSADVPLINATSATLGGTLANREIND